MEEHSKRVLCVGLCCLDIVMVCKSYPEEDSDQKCLSHVWQRGGNASNNSTIFAEFKIACEILGTLSNDTGGQFMKKDFLEHKIIFENCRFYEEHESPTSVVWINSQNGSRTIVNSNKGMPEVSFEDFKKLNLKNYSWIHFECRPHYEPMEQIIHYVKLWNAKENNNALKLSVEIEKPRKELIKLLHLGDFVFISKDFAQACGYSDMISAVDNLCHHLKPGAFLICAWGEKGAAAKSISDAVVTSPAYPPREIVNTLGAGDTFVATTIMCLMKGQNVLKAITTGCKVAGARCGMHNSDGLAMQFPELL